jgi:hypothetical protein
VLSGAVSVCTGATGIRAAFTLPFYDSPTRARVICRRAKSLQTGDKNKKAQCLFHRIFMLFEHVSGLHLKVLFTVPRD